MAEAEEVEHRVQDAVENGVDDIELGLVDGEATTNVLGGDDAGVSNETPSQSASQTESRRSRKAARGTSTKRRKKKTSSSSSAKTKDETARALAQNLQTLAHGDDEAAAGNSGPVKLEEAVPNVTIIDLDRDEDSDRRTERDRIASDDIEKYGVFQESHRITFRPLCFLEQLFLHILHPLLVPLFYWRYTSRNPTHSTTQAMSFNGFKTHPFHFLVFSTGHMVPACLWAAVAMYVMFRDQFHDMHISVFELVVPLTLFWVHRLMIAIKYASLSKAEYVKLMSCKDPRKSWHWHKSLLQFSGWVYPQRLVVADEVRKSALRQGLSLDQLRFTVSPQDSEGWLNHVFNSDTRAPRTQEDLIREWRAFLGYGQLHVNNDTGEISFCAISLVSAVFRHSCNKDYGFRPIMFAMSVASLIHTCIPLMVRALMYDAPVFGDSATSAIFVFLCCYVSFSYFFFASAFLLVALLDFARLHTSLKIMGNLIAVTENECFELDMSSNYSGLCSSQSEITADGDEENLEGTEEAEAAQSARLDRLSDAQIFQMKFCMDPLSSCTARATNRFFSRRRTPRLNLSSNTNIRAWTIARVLLRDFGARWRTRLAIYFAAAMVLAFVLLISVLVVFVQHFGQPDALRKDVILLFAAFDVFVWAVFLVCGVLLGAATNSLVGKQQRELLFRRLVLRDAVYRATSDNLDRRLEHEPTEEHVSKNEARKHFEMCDDLLEIATDTIGQFSSSQPVRVLGIPASYELAYSLCTAIIGVYVFFVNQLFVSSS